MKAVTVHYAKSHLLQLLEEVEESGEGVTIYRGDTPVASLRPHKRAVRCEPHPVMRDIVIDYDPTEPLAADEWPYNVHR